MAEIKTRKNDADVDAFLDAVEDPVRREDARALDALLRSVTGSPGAMWGDTIVGYGTRPITYADGRTEDWMALGFAPRKGNLTIYLNGRCEEYADVLDRLGKHKAKGGCLHITRMAQVDQDVLRELLAASYARG